MPLVKRFCARRWTREADQSQTCLPVPPQTSFPVLIQALQKQKKEQTVPITVRQLEAIVRIAESLARMQLLVGALPYERLR